MKRSWLILLAFVLTGASCQTARHTAVIADTGLYELLNDTHAVEQTALCGLPSCANVAGTVLPTVPGWTLEKSQAFNTKFLPAVVAGQQFNQVLARWDPTQPAPAELRGLIKSLGDALLAIGTDFPEGTVKGRLLLNMGRTQQIVLSVLDVVVLVKGT